MEDDFPAAHSMDSCWFAVDKDGRVGFFETGEGGAQPVAGLISWEAERARDRLGILLPARESSVDLRGRILPFLKSGGMIHTFGGTDIPVLMFLDSLEPVMKSLASGRARRIKARDGYAVIWNGLPNRHYSRLHQLGQPMCRGCFWRFEERGELEEAGIGREVNLARRGIYVFSALGGNATANPYGLQETPDQPIHVDELPPELRAAVKEVQFSAISFAEDPVFQPVEHVECNSYDGTYSNMSGRIGQLPSIHDGAGDEIPF